MSAATQPDDVRPAPSRVVVVFTGGEAPVGTDLADLPDDRLVIAADSGLDHATSLGVVVDLAVGDFDSVDPDVLAAAAQAGTVVERHPPAKDHTDLELALGRAREAGAERIVVVGGHGGRADHWLANALVLAGPSTVGSRVEMRAGASRLFVVRDRRRFQGTIGEVVSLLAVHGPAEGVSTEGLLFPLAGERLDAGSSRGVSNQLVAAEATVVVEAGVVLVVLPGEPGALPDDR